MNASTIGIAIVLGSLGVAAPALAGDVRAQLTPDLIYSHCQAAGVGSQTEGTFMLPGGRVTGTVLCTEADLAAANMMAATQYGDDEDDDDDHHHHRGPDDDDDRD